MTLTPGSRLGLYEVGSLIGSGGMGEVYRARDSKLNRDVALKILPESFALDPERLARFRREAQVLASLNHPSIAAIYGFEESDERQALVLELVEGPTLADRIAQGPIPLEEALPLAMQIADALEGAHEQGIIHRDLKPANIKVRPDGTVKVLDFGLAKALAGDRLTSPASLANSPTLTSPVGVTGVGVLLGTAAYMAPEQARGKVVDRRADIWSFGAVLFEMLTGRRLFIGDSASDLIAGVLKSDIDWSWLPSSTPAELWTLLRFCLVRDPRHRLQAIGDARIIIEDHLTNPGRLVPTRTARRDRAIRVVGAAALIAAIVSAGTTFYFRQRLGTLAGAPTLNVEITTPPTLDPLSMALSPDGRRLAFVGRSDGVERLWLRSLDAAASQPVSGTEGASYPFWSPDGRSIGFFAEGKLKRLDIAGGAPIPLATAVLGSGGTWNADGVIVFAPTATSALYRMSASGGEPTAITTLESPQASHRFPSFLPDGRRLLYSSGNVTRTTDVRLLSLGSTETRRLLESESAVEFASGHLFYLRDGALMAQRFDVAREELRGGPVLVANSVALDPVARRGAFSVSTGTIAHRASVATPRQLVWLDRSGKELTKLGPVDENRLTTLELAPDDASVVVDRNVQGNLDVYVMDTVRGESRRLTLGPKGEFDPLWSPDGKHIVFSSDRNGSYDLYQHLASGAGADEVLLESPLPKFPSDLSPDGRFLLYWQHHPQTALDLWVLPLFGDRKPFPFISADQPQWRGQFSPDGRWIAYESFESNRRDIFVQPFPGPGGKWQVSSAGGHSTRWAPDAKQIYYIAFDGKLMEVPIQAGRDTFQAGTPTALFQTHIVYGGDGPPGYVRPQYAVARDGRFLMNVTVQDVSAPPINLILNWSPMLTK